MKTLATLVVIFGFSLTSSSQYDESITAIDFIQIIDNQKKETVYYYQNNWKVLREKAVERGYIQSSQVLETPYTKEAPFHLMLITTYANKAQFDLREEHFEELIKEKGGLDLLNEKKPKEFRKSLFYKEMIRSWN